MAIYEPTILPYGISNELALGVIATFAVLYGIYYVRLILPLIVRLIN